MQVFLLILFGFVSGILGGMGMGGGTLLIPLLGFLPLDQKVIQAINLMSFVPMSVVALFFHAKNKLLNKQKLGYLVVPALLFAALGALLTKFAGQKLLRYCFGVLLLALGIWQLILSIKSLIRNKNHSN